MRDLTKTQNEILEILKPNTEVVLFGVSYNNNQLSQFSAIKAVVNSDYSLNTLETLETKSINKIKKMLECPVITGYNVGFDIRILRNEAKKKNVDFDIVPTFDLINLARDFLTKPEDVANFQFATVAEALLNEKVKKNVSLGSSVALTLKMLEVLLARYVAYIPETELQTKLLKAKLSYDFISKELKRINVKLSFGKEGDVYYDIPNKEWRARGSVADKVFLPSVEKQFKAIYMTPFGYTTMDEVIDSWFTYAEQACAKKTTKKK